MLRSQGLKWQENFFDHRLRENIPAEDFARYIYLNPYAKRLIPLASSWPYWILNKNYRPEFYEHLENGVGAPEQWLANYRNIAGLIDDDMEP